ncbi:MAG: thiamine pyrophosphate-dependent enzyme [Thermomicrobiales bacterium]
MRRAVSRLVNGAQGPVVLEIARDVGLAEAVPSDSPYRPVVRALAVADTTSVARAAEAMTNASRPLIVVGQGALYSEAAAELREFAELLHAPVMTTLAGKSAFPENHPLSLGTGALTSPATVPHFLGWCDLIVGVGSSLKQHFMTVDLPMNVPVVQITRNAEDLNSHYQVEHPLVGDARLVLQQLLAELRDRRFSYEKSHPDRAGLRREIDRVKAEWLAEWHSELSSAETPINPYRFVQEFIRAVDPDLSIVTHDSGSPRDQLLPFYQANQPRSYIGWGKSHALGSGMGLIMGAKLARPDLNCLHVMGDAAFGMVGLDLETAVRERIPIVSIVLNNNIMAIESDTMRVAHSKYGSRKLGGEYTGVARSLGALAARVEDPAEIGPTLQAAMRSSQEQGLPFLVEVITRPEMTSYSHRKF